MLNLAAQAAAPPTPHGVGSSYDLDEIDDDDENSNWLADDDADVLRPLQLFGEEVESEIQYFESRHCA